MYFKSASVLLKANFIYLHKTKGIMSKNINLKRSKTMNSVGSKVAVETGRCNEVTIAVIIKFKSTNSA